MLWNIVSMGITFIFVALLLAASFFHLHGCSSANVQCGYLVVSQIDRYGLRFEFYYPNRTMPNELKLSYTVYSLDSTVPLLEYYEQDEYYDIGGVVLQNTVDGKYHRHLIVYSYEYIDPDYNTSCANMFVMTSSYCIDFCV